MIIVIIWIAASIILAIIFGIRHLLNVINDNKNMRDFRPNTKDSLRIVCQDLQKEFKHLKDSWLPLYNQNIFAIELFISRHGRIFFNPVTYKGTPSISITCEHDSPSIYIRQIVKSHRGKIDVRKVYKKAISVVNETNKRYYNHPIIASIRKLANEQGGIHDQ